MDDRKSDFVDGTIRLMRADDGTITVAQADPVVWFAAAYLDMLLAQPDPGGGWDYDGQFITLTVANGVWIWKLTGRSRIAHEGSANLPPLVQVEAVWPD